MNKKPLPIKLKLPATFLVPETKCEFFMPEKLKRIHAVELDLLNEFLAVCKKYKIKVGVFAGTLLGAVRHKGFIPWDDDIDVCMSRQEFEKLLKIAPKEFSYPYFFQSLSTDPLYLLGYARLRNSETTGRITWQDSNDYNNGIYIDIFVLDGIPENNFLRRLQRRFLGKFNELWNMYHTPIATLPGRTKFLIRIKKFLLLLLGRCALMKMYHFTLTFFNKRAERFGLVTHNEEFMEKYYLRKEEFEDTIEMPFEMLTVPVFCNYNAILKRSYGSKYMDFPPMDQRGKWHEGELTFDPDTPYNSKQQ